MSGETTKADSTTTDTEPTVVATDDDYRRLLAFRTGLRRFLRWSEEQAAAVGLTAAQHQLLLAVRGLDGDGGPTIGEISEVLLLKHHSTVGLVDRAKALGLVRRTKDPHDGRVVRVVLTPAGQDLLEQLSARHLAELEQMAPTLRALIRDAAPH
jgi:DNA-binding MarR family transcriptional regulator